MLILLFKKYQEIIKKAVLVIVVYSVIVGLFAYFIQGNRISLSFSDADSAAKKEEMSNYVVNNPELNSSSQGKIIIALYRTFACGLLGEVCIDNTQSKKIQYQNSLAGQLTRLIAMPFINPPASGIYWTKSVLENSGFISKSYAAEGVGFAAIKPLIPLWTVFRNISYMLLVLVLVAIGFMIMFRMKLNPQTVISVENALPKIVTSMILITFSFPIAGFLIDLMYVISGLIVSILFVPAEAGKITNEYLSAGAGSIFTAFWPRGILSQIELGGAIMNLLPWWVDLLVRLLLIYFLAIPFVLSFFRNVGGENVTTLLDNINLFTFSIGKAPSGIIKQILYVVIILVVTMVGPALVLGILIFFTALYMLFRIIFLLLKAYIQIILLIIFAPLILLFEAIPSGKSAFSFWIKNIFAEVMTFPIVIAIFSIARILADLKAYQSPILPSWITSSSLWKPPFLTTVSDNAFAILIGMSLVFMVPELVKSAKEMMGVKPLPFGFGIGTFFAGTGAAVGGAMGGIGSFSSIAMAFPGLRTALASKGGKGGLMDKLFGSQTTTDKVGPATGT